MNTITKELNMNEMELINGGWNWKEAIYGMAVTGIVAAGIGGSAAGVPGAVIGGLIGVGIGATFGLD